MSKAPNGFVQANNIKSWGEIKRYDNYLRGELKKQKENGIIKTENNLYNSFNCQRDNFTKTAMAYMQMEKEKDSKILAKTFTVSFSHDDEEKNGLTPQKAHEMSMQFAKEWNFQKYPTLAVTHTDTNNLHTQFIVASVNVENGDCFHQDKKMLRDMKKTWGKILEQNGMTETIKAMNKADEKREIAEQETKKQNKKVYPEKEYHKSMAERKINERGKATDKQLVGYYIHQAVDEKKVTSIEDFKNELAKQEINVETRGKSFVFHYTTVKGKEQPVRDNNLAKTLEDESLKREEIEKRIQENAEREKEEFLKKADEQDKEYEKWRLINQRNGECLNLHKEVEKYDDKLLEAKKEQNKINDTDKSILEARSQQDKEREAKLMAEKEELVRAKEDIRKQLEDISVRYAEIEKRINDINKELDKNYPDDPKVKEIQKEKNEKLNEREFKRVYGETNAKLEMSQTGARERVTEAGAEASNIQRSTQQQEQKQTEAEKPKNRVVPHM